MSEAGDGQRIDVWLFRARLFKSRSGAGRFVADGGVRLERDGRVGRVRRASAEVRPGDVLVYHRGRRLFRVTVRGLAERRGPAAEARLLYALADAEEDA